MPYSTMMVHGRIKALFLLMLTLLKVCVRRIWARRSGLRMFRQNYDADQLPPVSLAERDVMPSFGSCIACGLCDEGEGNRIEASGGGYPGLMQLTLASSRNMPDFREAAASFRWVPERVLSAKERVCPAGVPFVALARFVQAKAEQVGGPSIGE